MKIEMPIYALLQKHWIMASIKNFVLKLEVDVKENSRTTDLDHHKFHYIVIQAKLKAKSGK